MTRKPDADHMQQACFLYIVLIPGSVPLDANNILPRQTNIGPIVSYSVLSCKRNYIIAIQPLYMATLYSATIAIAT